MADDVASPTPDVTLSYVRTTWWLIEKYSTSTGISTAACTAYVRRPPALTSTPSRTMVRFDWEPGTVSTPARAA